MTVIHETLRLLPGYRGGVSERAPIESPCTGICTVDAEGSCVGCGRTLDEIAGWAGMTPDQRRAIMASLPARDAFANPPAGT